MSRPPVRKFADFVTGKAQEPAQSRVTKAFSNIRNTPDGAVIEQYFLHLLSRTLPDEATNSALRENAVERKLASRIVRMMNEAQPGDGTGSTAGSAGQGPGARRRRKPGA